MLCFKGSQTEIAPLVVRFLFCESEYDRFHALARLGEMYLHLIYFVISADITRWLHDIFDNIEIWSITCIVAMRLAHVSFLGCLMQKIGFRMIAGICLMLLIIFLIFLYQMWILALMIYPESIGHENFTGMRAYALIAVNFFFLHHRFSIKTKDVYSFRSVIHRF